MRHGVPRGREQQRTRCGREERSAAGPRDAHRQRQRWRFGLLSEGVAPDADNGAEDEEEENDDPQEADLDVMAADGAAAGAAPLVSCGALLGAARMHEAAEGADEGTGGVPAATRAHDLRAGDGMTARLACPTAHHDSARPEHHAEAAPRARTRPEAAHARLAQLGEVGGVALIGQQRPSGPVGLPARSVGREEVGGVDPPRAPPAQHDAAVARRVLAAFEAPAAVRTQRANQGVAKAQEGQHGEAERAHDEGHTARDAEGSGGGSGKRGDRWEIGELRP